MASNRNEIGLSLVLVLMLMQWNGARAQSGCTTALLSLSPCLNYVTGNTTMPSSSCCSQLSRVVASQPRCLCSVLNGGGSSFGVSINQTLAVALPSACNVQTPPVSRCNAGANGPAASPADSPPADSSKGSPDGKSEPDIPSGTGSKITGGTTSRGSIVELPLHLTATSTFIAAFSAFASTFL
ncbi:PREDICTED: non-specific lipid-transfer protein-like protein At2g13820 [Nicotiana attenuata]|uniref:Non-specific lipid-transfer protein-like protein n=1 Tax=Nicotiana attenuata TaxID=49451 RepID=A0A1J6JEL1_NICAT|nr:PREDICTED: non-specific lipid-transfer protein-like protein At2g13820 [Nicotiana attenuata]OIT08111.1 non-specific lipid-transfer protein-like protein [Nicotiana attenuata]